MRSMVVTRLSCVGEIGVDNPDDVLCRTEHIVASADSYILDHASRWTNLASDVVRNYVPDEWVVDFVHQTSAQ